MAKKKIPNLLACVTCGGTGAQPFVALGPFFVGLKARTRAILEAHLPARRAVFELMDRELARGAVKAAKEIDAGTLAHEDILGEALLRLEKACGDYMEGDQTQAIAQLIAITTNLLFVLESFEAEQAALREIEDRE